MSDYPVHVPELPSKEARDRLAGLAEPLLRVAQPRLYGIENIHDGGVLLVGNHTIYGFLDLPLMMAGCGSANASPFAGSASTPTT